MLNKKISEEGEKYGELEEIKDELSHEIERRNIENKQKD
jgi:hypothetical protein